MPSYSVPTSPAMTRSTSSRNQPVTPQRHSAPRPHHRYSSSQSYYRSPITPASPYTPLSLRSYGSSGSGGSSTLTTPDHVGLNAKRLFSLDMSKCGADDSGRDHSLADIAENWRSRANENGPKTMPSLEDSHFGDDEASEKTLSEAGNDSGLVTTEEALLPAAFLLSQRRAIENTRPRAQSQAPLPGSRALSSPTVLRGNRPVLPPSPLVTRRLNQSQNDLMSTPPQNRIVARQLKLKGSFTDPARPRREDFGAFQTRSQIMNALNNSLNMDTSLNLFDIDENDYEYEYETHDRQYPHTSNVGIPLFGPSFQNVDANENAYNYPPHSLPLLAPHDQQFPLPTPPLFGDPFNGHVLSSISESVEHHFQRQNSVGHDQLPPPFDQYQLYASDAPRPRNGIYNASPAWVPVPAPVPRYSPVSVDKKVVEPESRNSSPATTAAANDGCSVCLATNPPTLAVLVPCSHPLCSTCLTSALNIVGEKDMECAVCKTKVADFKLVMNAKPKAVPNQVKVSGGDMIGKSFMDPIFSSPGSGKSVNGLDNASEFALGLEGVRASTPKPEQQVVYVSEDGSSGGQESWLTADEIPQRTSRRYEENVVLRIDNVPWDITPPQIKAWLQQPVERVHVLLDSRGKTMSHAYVEVSEVAIAGKILRGEGGGLPENASGSKKIKKMRERSSILGKGKRARGVTITRSSQEELMADLFPNWKGSFDGSRPSLAKLDSTRVITALEGGLLGEAELTGLLQLIRAPDSHFLKVPCLPFHSLISILCKFPVDVDSRVFWCSNVRDLLYDVAYAAIQILHTRVKESSTEDAEYTVELVMELVNTGMNCRAFTSQQVIKMIELGRSLSLPVSPAEPSKLDSSDTPAPADSEPHTPRSDVTRGQISVSQVAAVAASNRKSYSNSPSANGDQNSGGALADIAREFGVEAQLVQALAQRLANLA